MEPKVRKRLINAALSTREKAYAPYSNFHVGAAVLTTDGTVFTGANVENASYGLAICAERIAAATAVSAGHRNITAVAVATTGGASPCGACRQFLAEFGPAMDVLIIDTKDADEAEVASLEKLLPAQFQLKM